MINKRVIPAKVTVSPRSDTKLFRYDKNGMFEPWNTCTREGEWVEVKEFDALHDQAMRLQAQRDAVQLAYEECQPSNFPTFNLAFNALRDRLLRILDDDLNKNEKTPGSDKQAIAV
jgi:hypothetical protein